MKRIGMLVLLACVGGVLPMARGEAGGEMVVTSASGPVTAEEVGAFKKYMAGVEPPASGGGNVWVFGHAGKALEACGLMYEATHDVEILNRALVFADAAIETRNDLLAESAGGQRKAWTGKVEPIWPSNVPAEGEKAGGAVEQGQVLSHIALTARLILQNEKLWGGVVPDGDPHRLGRTYRERAVRYVKECDHVIDAWILPHYVRTSEEDHYYFPGESDSTKANEPAPWNQAWMLTNGLVRLAECHTLLKDDAKRVGLYEGIARSNIAWFLADQKENVSAARSMCTVWPYTRAAPRIVEDTNHAAYDSEGLWIAYESGRYGLTRGQMRVFANTYVDVVMGTKREGRFAGRVDGTTGAGHSGGDEYVRDEYLYWAEFRPDAWGAMVAAEVSTKRVEGSPPVVGRLLWEKDRRWRGVAGK